MTKNKWIALGLIVVAFFLCFTPGINNMNFDSPILTLVSFLILVFATLAALFIGNNDNPQNHESH